MVHVTLLSKALFWLTFVDLYFSEVRFVYILTIVIQPNSGPLLDVYWRNNNSFSTSFTDGIIYVCNVGEHRPVKRFSGHQNEINAIEWVPCHLYALKIPQLRHQLLTIMFLGDIYHQMESKWCWYKQFKSIVIAGKVESIAYDVEYSKNDSISKKNKSIEPLDGMHDLWKPLNKLVTKVDTLDNSKVPVRKFISSSPLINLDDYENEDDDDNEEKDRKGKKGRRERKKKETNNPPASPPLVGRGGDADSGGGGTNINVAQVQVTTETT
ncbi:hypothetical protein MTR67_038856 [Solanum verrucosum]|uniref:Uncharacterized protein n=1 Tax=Solanum verrucosum TaxID=315347 RepID=A0AAF0UH12_SOLVR|nr:hypothetical protein MTR67_038856 [Solanum verrucosum]